MIAPEAALTALLARARPLRGRTPGGAAQEPDRVPGSEIEALVADWRAGASVRERVKLAAGLWDSGNPDARIAAAKLLAQARIPEDEALVWAEFLRWVPQFANPDIADRACGVGARRLVAEPARLDVVARWVRHPAPLTRRAAFTVTLPWSKQAHPSAADLAVRERVIGWTAAVAADPEREVLEAAARWLGSLSIRDPDRVRAVLAGPGAPLARLVRRRPGAGGDAVGSA